MAPLAPHQQSNPIARATQAPDRQARVGATYTESLNRYIVLVIYIALGLGQVGTVRGQAIELCTNLTHTLGQSYKDPNEMFGDPILASFDQNGYVYVFDRLSLKAKVFDPLGEWQYSLGGRGTAGGRLQSMSTAYLGAGTEVVVIDQIRQRAVALLRDGQYRERPLPDAMSWPAAALLHRDTLYLTYYHRDNIYIVNSWDVSLSLHIGHWIDRTDLFSEQSIHQSIYGARPGILTEWQGYVAFIPGACNGRVYLIDPEARHDAAAVLFGAFVEEFQGGGPGRNQPLQASDIGCWTIGAGVLASGALAVFSLRGRAPEMRMHVELFGEAGTLIGYHEVFDYVGRDFLDLPQVALTSQGYISRAALIDRRRRYPLVHLYDLDIAAAGCP